MMRFLSFLVVSGAMMGLRGDLAATEAETASFQQFVRGLAKQRGQRVEDWWAVNLDDDPGLELVAILCGAESSDFVIQKDEQHRWDVHFEVDGLTVPSCESEQPLDPKPENRHRRLPKVWPAQGLDYRRGHRGGYEIVRVGLRGGRTVIIRKEELNDSSDGDKPVVTDWDRLVRRGKAHSYPPIPARAAGDGESTLGLILLDLQ